MYDWIDEYLCDEPDEVEVKQVGNVDNSSVTKPVSNKVEPSRNPTKPPHK